MSPVQRFEWRKKYLPQCLWVLKFFLLLEKHWQKFSQGYKIYIKLVVQGARCDGMIE